MSQDQPEASEQHVQAPVAPPVAAGWWTARPYQVAKWVAAVAVAALVARHLYSLGSGRTFFYDEWDFVRHRRSFSADALLRPHNGHFSLVPAAVYVLVFETLGMQHYGLLRVVGIVVHLTLSAVVGVMVRRRWNWLIGCAAAFAVALMGAGWQNIMWPFQIGYMGSLLFTMAAVHQLDRSDHGVQRRPLIVAAVLAVLAVTSSGLGVPGLAAVALVCWLPAHRRRTWWVPVPAAAVYGLWYLVYGESEAKVSNAHLVPGYVGRAGRGAVSGLFRVGDLAGGLGLAVVAAVVVYAAVRRRLDARTSSWLVFVLSFWVLTALSRAQRAEPAASRYVYVGAVLLMLIVADTAPALPSRRWLRVTVSLMVAAVSLITVQRSHELLTMGANGLRYEGYRIRVELAVVDAVGERLDRTMRVDPVHAPVLHVGDYLDAAADLGSSPAYSVSVVAGVRPDSADGVDRLLEPLFTVRPGTVDATACQSGDHTVSEVFVDVGSTAYVVADDAQQITIARFAQPGASGAEPRSADAGVLALVAPTDPFVAPWWVSFSSPVTLLTCS